VPGFCSVIPNIWTEHLIAAVVDVYCNYEAGAQDEKGTTVEDTATTVEWHGKVEVRLAWRSQEEVLLTRALLSFLLLSCTL